MAFDVNCATSFELFNNWEQRFNAAIDVHNTVYIQYYMIVVLLAVKMYIFWIYYLINILHVHTLLQYIVQCWDMWSEYSIFSNKNMIYTV